MALAQTGLNISIFFVLLPKYLALHSTSFNRRVANLDFVDGGMLYQVLTLSMYWWPVEVDIRLISKFQRRLRFIQIIYVSVKLLQGAVCVIDGLCLDPVQIGGDSGVHARLRAATTRASADHANSVYPVVRGVCVVDTATRIGLEGGRESKSNAGLRTIKKSHCHSPGTNPYPWRRCRSCSHWHSHCPPCIAPLKSSGGPPFAASSIWVPRIRWYPNRRQ